MEELKTEVKQYASCATRLKSALANRLEVAESQAVSFITKQSAEFLQANEVAEQLKQDIEQLRHRHGSDCANLKLKVQCSLTFCPCSMSQLAFAVSGSID